MNRIVCFELHAYSHTRSSCSMVMKELQGDGYWRLNERSEERFLWNSPEVKSARAK